MKQITNTKMRRKLIAANWKMNKTIKESIDFLESFLPQVSSISDRDILICPPFTCLSEMNKKLNGSKVQLGGQNMYHEDFGAFTGDISPIMLKDVSCSYVLIGHSDRREFFKEDNAFLNAKIKAALKNNLRPILCIGETHQERADGKTKAVLHTQMDEGLRGLTDSGIRRIDLAYEPIWAISRGDPSIKAATTGDAQAAHTFIRSEIQDLFNDETAKNMRILYGGSMNEKNASELLKQKDIDGGLVGGASLDAEKFALICKS